MTDIYSRAQSQAERALNKYGRDCHLVSFVKSGTDYDPDITEVLTPCKVLQSIFTTNEIDGTLVRRDDKKFLIGSDHSPIIEMNLKDGDKTYSIISILEVKPGPTLIMSKIQARL